jgi:hypothetical protein
MIVNTDEFYIPAFCFEWRAKVNQLSLAKDFFGLASLIFLNKNPPQVASCRGF